MIHLGARLEGGGGSRDAVRSSMGRTFCLQDSNKPTQVCSEPSQKEATRRLLVAGGESID